MTTDCSAAPPFKLIRHLSPSGQAEGELPPFAQDPKALIPLYQAMLRTRAFDTKAVSLQRTGRLGTFAASLGQEAVGVGLASAMRADDILVPSFRDQAAQLWRGVTPVELLLFWGGDERGSDFSGPRHDFPISVPVASQVPHAAGAALAIKLRHEERAVLCILGDGGSSKGDFYEALNLAGVWQLPLVVVIANNQWAISVPRAAQSATASLAQKAIAAGIPGEQVDGNDVIAMHDRVGQALERARAGKGATLIEAVTYRLSDHTTADDARRYRADDEVSEHWREDPIARLRQYLVETGAWGREQEEEAVSAAAAEMDQATATYLATPPQPLATVFDHTFATLPAGLAAQREAALAEEAGNA